MITQLYSYSVDFLDRSKKCGFPENITFNLIMSLPDVQRTSNDPGSILHLPQKLGHLIIDLWEKWVNILWEKDKLYIQLKSIG